MNLNKIKSFFSKSQSREEALDNILNNLQIRDIERGYSFSSKFIDSVSYVKNKIKWITYFSSFSLDTSCIDIHIFNAYFVIETNTDKNLVNRKLIYINNFSKDNFANYENMSFDDFCKNNVSNIKLSLIEFDKKQNSKFLKSIESFYNKILLERFQKIERFKSSINLMNKSPGIKVVNNYLPLVGIHRPHEIYEKTKLYSNINITPENFFYDKEFYYSPFPGNLHFQYGGGVCLGAHLHNLGNHYEKFYNFDELFPNFNLWYFSDVLVLEHFPDNINKRTYYVFSHLEFLKEIGNLKSKNIDPSSLENLFENTLFSMKEENAPIEDIEEQEFIYFYHTMISFEQSQNIIKKVFPS